MLPRQLFPIVRTAPLRYKVFTIKKRDGTDRTIAQPAREVKAIQRWLVQELRSRLPVHDCVTAYEPGTSVKANAERHSRSRFLLKLDFKNFFPSIRAADVQAHLERHCLEYTLPERDLIARACCWLPSRLATLQLCVGAPSSPFLSNTTMYEFDCTVSRMAELDGVTYTRYADDISLSCNERDILSQYPSFIEQTLQALPYPKIRLNAHKTVHASHAGNRTITGIVLTPTGNLSVGRERKRLVRSMYHRSTLGLLSVDEQHRLDGLLAFIDDIEPGFSARLKRNSYPPASGM